MNFNIQSMSRARNRFIGKYVLFCVQIRKNNKDKLRLEKYFKHKL